MPDRKVLDLSNWNWNDDTGVRHILERFAPLGYDYAYIRLSTESDRLVSIARASIDQVLNFGWGCGGYIWQYPDLDPVAHTQNALWVAEGAGYRLSNVVTDAEETSQGFRYVHAMGDLERPPHMGQRLKTLRRLQVDHAKGKYVMPWQFKSTYTAHDIVEWLVQSMNVLGNKGYSGGVYSAGWYWIPYCGNSPRLAEMGVDHWFASYDDNPDRGTWSEGPYGGWSQAQVKAKQFNGTEIDKNVVDPAWIGAIEPGPTPSPGPSVDDLKTALAYVCDSVGDQLDVRRLYALERHALVAEMRRVREQFLGPRP